MILDVDVKCDKMLTCNSSCGFFLKRVKTILKESTNIRWLKVRSQCDKNRYDLGRIEILVGRICKRKLFSSSYLQEFGCGLHKEITLQAHHKDRMVKVECLVPD